MKHFIDSINEVNRSNLIAIIDFIEKNKNQLEYLKRHLGEFSHSNGFGTDWFKPLNLVFREIAIFVKDQKLTGFSIRGNFNLTLNDLIILFGDYRAVYVPYDDEYNLVFKSSNLSYSVVIHDKQDYPSIDLKLWWVTVNFL